VQTDTSYHRYTELDKEPGGLRRLDLIADAIESHWQSSRARPARILDVGCGNGHISVPLASLGHEVVGVDSDPRSIERARDANPFPNATFVVQDALALDIDGPFDAVVCCEILEHLPQPLRFLESISSVLVDDGVLLVTIPNGYSVEEILRRFLTRTRPGLFLRGFIRRWLLREKTVQTENVESPHLQYFTLGSLHSLVEQGQLTITDEANWTTFFMPLYYIFLRLFIKRGSEQFRSLDKWDASLAEGLPLALGGGWFFVIARDRETSTMRDPVLAAEEENQ